MGPVPHDSRAVVARLLRARTPRLVATPLLVGVNIAAYIFVLVASGRQFNVASMLRWGALYGPLVGTGEWWRVLSVAFLHAGLWHLLLNMIALVYAGPIVERMVGPALFLVCYLMAAVVASSTSLLVHPTQVGVGASGAVFGVVGMIVAITVRGRRLSALAVITETVAAVDSTIVPVSRAITKLDLSTPRDSKDHVAPTSVAASPLPEDSLRSTSTDDVLRHLYAGLLPFVVYNLILGGLESGIDGAAHVGGLAAGVVFGWAISRDILTAKPSIAWGSVPIVVAGMTGAAAIMYVSTAQSLPFAIARFEKIDARTLTTFQAALSQLQSRVRSSEDVGNLVETTTLPELDRERLRGSALVSDLQRRLKEVEQKDATGRMARWREREPTRNELARATAWRDYLVEREGAWRLRLDSLRAGTPEKLPIANDRDASAASRLAEALRQRQ